MAHVESFVLADLFQYSRQSFQNRARLRTPQGWHWITVPLKGGQRGRPIARVAIEGREPWLRKHWRSLEYNYRSAPYFAHYEPHLYPLFTRPWSCLGELTSATVVLLAELLGLTTALRRASALQHRPETLQDAMQAVRGETLLVPEEAAVHDALLVPGACVFRYREPFYQQVFEGFEPHLSALDLLFNVGPAARTMLRDPAAVHIAVP